MRQGSGENRQLTAVRQAIIILHFVNADSRVSPSLSAPAPTPVATYLARIPPARRKELVRVRSTIRKHLPPGYKEVLRGSIIAYEVPLATYPDTYNGRPLWFAALAAPKSYLTLHLMPVYASPELLGQLKEGFRAAGKKLDIGKACIHFQTADDLALDVIGRIIRSMPLARWVEIAKAARRR
jgi:hypothetical protein